MEHVVNNTDDSISEKIALIILIEAAEEIKINLYSNKYRILI